MNYFLYFIFFLFSFGQLGRITLYERQINFYFYEVFLLIFLFILFFKHKFSPLKLVWQKFREFYIFFGVLFLSLINEFWKYSFFQNFVGFLYFSRLLFYGLIGVYIFYETLKNKNFKKNIRIGINILTIITIITTITQYFLYPDLRNLMYLGWDPHLERTFGVFFDTSIAAVIYGMIFFLQNNIFIKIIYLIFLLLTYSRSVILSFFIALFFYFFQNKKSIFNFFLILFLFLGILFLIPKPTGEGGKLTRVYTITSRINDYKEAINLFLKKPILGWGYNRLRYVRGIYNSNAGANFSSSYMTIITTSGLIGLIIMIRLIGLIKLIRNKKSIIILILIASFFDNIFLHPFILFLLIFNLFDR